MSDDDESGIMRYSTISYMHNGRKGSLVTREALYERYCEVVTKTKM